MKYEEAYKNYLNALEYLAGFIDFSYQGEEPN